MSERTFDEVFAELISVMDNPLDSYVSKKDEVELAETLSKVRGLPEFLRATMGADMKRYFAATPEEQQRIKGAFQRTMYLLSLSVPKKNIDYVKSKLTGTRKKQGDLQSL